MALLFLRPLKAICERAKNINQESKLGLIFGAAAGVGVANLHLASVISEK